MTRASFAAIAFAAATLASGIAHADTMKFTGNLTNGAEVPPKTGSGAGTATASLDTVTKVLTYDVTFSGLSGPATMGHLHGPAMPGTNAGVVVPFANPVTSPVHGTATLTDAQVADLEAGKYYANVHTSTNPGGEIRAQMMPVK